MNKLDQFCKQHDIIYSKFKNTELRSHFDEDLTKVVSQRDAAKDANIGETIAAMGVAGIMTEMNKLRKQIVVFDDYL